MPRSCRTYYMPGRLAARSEISVSPTGVVDTVGGTAKSNAGGAGLVSNLWFRVVRWTRLQFSLHINAQLACHCSLAACISSGLEEVARSSRG